MSLAANIRTRRAMLNWSQKQLAQKAGVSQQLINALEAERVRNSKYIRDIATALGCVVSDLDQNYGGMAEDGIPIAGVATKPGDLPIFSAFEVDAQSIVISNESVDFISRPEPLMNVRGGYGIIVANNMMFPEFEIGDLALVNPHLPPVPGTTSLFSSQVNGQKYGRIRRLVNISPEYWIVKMWQAAPGSDELKELPREAWPKCERIIGRYCRR